jgi:hypothetical protein
MQEVDRVRVYVDYQPMRRMLDEIHKLNIDLLIRQWMGPSSTTGVPHSPTTIAQFPFHLGHTASGCQLILPPTHHA